MGIIFFFLSPKKSRWPFVNWWFTNFYGIKLYMLVSSLNLNKYSCECLIFCDKLLNYVMVARTLSHKPSDQRANLKQETINYSAYGYEILV